MCNIGNIYIYQLTFLYYFCRYNNICDVYTEFKRKSSYETVRMNMMKLVFKFLRIRTELNNENIIDVIRYWQLM